MTATLDLPRHRPGVHDDMPEADYHAATYALSASGAKLILDCPARLKWAQDHPVRKRVYDIGSAAHKLVLGAGPRVQVISKPDWRTNEAKAARAAAYASGCIPVLKHEHDHVRAMADALRKHPVASALFDPECGLPERSLFWDDPEFGIPRRARFDWLRDPRGARLLLVDYKTCEDASPDAVRKAVGNYGYHIQDATYREGAIQLGLDDDPGFVFVFQEKSPPYLINVVQLDAGAVQSGRIAIRAAAEIFRDCTASGLWPGYEREDIPEVSLPPWATRIPEEYYQS